MTYSQPKSASRAALLRLSSSAVPAGALAAIAREMDAIVVALHEPGTATTPPSPLLLGALNGHINVLVVDSILSLGPSGAQAIETAGKLVDAGVRLVSATSGEAWVTQLGAAVGDLGRWLATAAQQRRAAAVKAGVAAARAAGRRPGRPARQVPDAALELAQRTTVGAASRTFGIPATSLRRALARERLAALVPEREAA